MEDVGDVLVVGAGPVGLLTALGLAQQGARVTVLDAAALPNDSPRAMTYTDPTLRLLNRLGLLDAAEQVGIRNRSIKFFWPADDLIVDIDPGVAEPTRTYPYNLHFGQEALGQIAIDALAKLPNAEIRWSHRVTSLEHDASGATVTVETPAGEQRLRADWLVGTDGGRSFIRQALGLEFEGFTWPERFVATNVYYDFDKYGYGGANMICDGPNWGMAAKITAAGLYRLTYGEDASISEAEVLARIPAHYQRLMPGGERYQMVSAAPYRVHERSCPTYRVGRVLLAGDAAHICNPAGGRGLTGGIMDVDVLLDALGGVLGGRSGEAVLDAYSETRRKEFLEVSSPFAQTMKRMWSETDHAQQQLDQAEIMKLSVGQSKISLAGLRRE